MSKIVLGKKAPPNPGPYLKDVNGDPLLLVRSQQIQATQPLDTDYALDVGSAYLLDVQPDLYSISGEVGYPLQAAPDPSVITLESIKTPFFHTGTQSSSNTLTALSGLTVGELILVHMVGGRSYGHTTPAGYVKVFEAFGAGGASCRIFGRIATGDASDNPAGWTYADDTIIQVTTWSGISDLGAAAALCAPASTGTMDTDLNDTLTAAAITSWNDNSVVGRAYGAHGGGASDLTSNWYQIETIYGDITSSLFADQLYSTTGAQATLDAVYAANVAPDGAATPLMIRPLIAARPQVTYGSGASTATTYIDVAYPSTTAGETIYCAITQPQSGSPATPAGWTLVTYIDDDVDTNNRLHLYQRDAVATGSESGAVRWSSAVRNVGIMFSVTASVSITSYDTLPAAAVGPGGTAADATVLLLRMNGTANWANDGLAYTSGEGAMLPIGADWYNAYTPGLFHSLYIYELDVDGNVPDIYSTVGEVAIYMVLT